MPVQNTFYTPGPAALYPKFEVFLKDFVDQQLGSISHRSQKFKDIYQFTDQQLRQLMNIPDENAIMFTGTASEIWERILLNLSDLETFHLVNGSFSKKFFQYAEALGRHAHVMEKPMGEGFSYSEIEVPEFAEIICVTQNETSSGVQTREADIHKLKRGNADKLVAVDMVSSAPIPELDFSLIDTAFFSVQKSFGLPAGLGVWVANETCLARAQKLSETTCIGAHSRLPELWEQSKVYQTPATPNVMGIYLLGRVAEDMNHRGIDNLRKETEQKAKKLYQYFEKKSGFSVATEKVDHRSKTVAVINTERPSSEIIGALKQKNLIIGSGYGKNKETQLRIANFIATGSEEIDSLLAAFDEL